MTTHGTSISIIQSIIAKAHHSEDGLLRKKKTGAKNNYHHNGISRVRRIVSPKQTKAYLDVIQENKRLGIEVKNRDPKLKGLRRISQKTVHLSLTESQVKDLNKERISKILAKKKLRDAAKKLRDAADTSPITGKKKRRN